MKINNSFHLCNMNNYNSKLNKDSKNVSFGSLQKIGDKFLKSDVLQGFVNHFEFEGFSMPFAALAAICTCGVILPRLAQARDKDEFKEICIRDCTTVGIMLFARKGLQNIFSKAFSNLSGLPLLKYPDKHEGLFKSAFNYLRPVNGVSILSSADIKSKFTNIDKFRNGIVDFCDFVTKSKGDVKKLFTSNDKLAEKTKQAFDSLNTGIDFASATSEQLTNAFTYLHANKSDTLNGIYEFFRDGKNPIMSKARFYNSTFDFLATFVLVPTMLGYGLPKLMENKLKDKYLNKDGKKEVNNSQDNGTKSFTLDKKYYETLKTPASAKISAFKDFV